MRPHDWKGSIYVEQLMRDAGFDAWAAYLELFERIGRREGLYQSDETLVDIWRQAQDQYVGIGLGEDWLRNRTPAVLGAFNAISGLPTDRAIALHKELRGALVDVKRAEISALGLDCYGNVIEERLIGLWYELAGADGWRKAKSKDFDLPFNMPIVAKQISPSGIAIAMMEHSGVNLEAGVLPITLGALIDDESLDFAQGPVARGMFAYECFEDGGEAALGMLAYLRLASAQVEACG